MTGFIKDSSLVSPLRDWGELLLGQGAFGNADAVKWRFLSLNAGVSSKTAITLPLDLHSRYGPREIFAAVGETYTSKDRSKNTGLSPRYPDGGYLLFITLDKATFDPAYDYDDELGVDWFRWTTRRDRDENHIDAGCPDAAALIRKLMLERGMDPDLYSKAGAKQNAGR